MVADGLLAALVTLIALPMLFLPSPTFERLHIGFRDPGALAVLLTLCQTVPLVWRRRAPYAVLAATWAAATVHMALGFKPTFAEAAMVVAVYTVAAHRPRREAALAGILFAAGMVGYGLIAEARYPTPFVDSLQSWVLIFVQFAAAFFLGDVQKRRLAYMAKLEALNTQLATEQELRSRWAVAEERGRIARELHDVVAHSVSVMVVQAGAARRTMAASPDQATTALGQIESTGRQALVELRRLLGLLRDGDRGDSAALTPQPGWSTWSRSPRRPVRPACRSRSRSRATRGRCPPGSPCRPTGSCRRRSPTRSSTPARRGPACASATAATSSRSRSPTTAKPPAVTRSRWGTARGRLRRLETAWSRPPADSQ
jgi:Histidine kinase